MTGTKATYSVFTLVSVLPEILLTTKRSPVVVEAAVVLAVGELVDQDFFPTETGTETGTVMETVMGTVMGTEYQEVRIQVVQQI